MKRWVAPFVAGLLVAVVVGAGTASAHTVKNTFDFHAGDNFGGFLASPDVTAADNGDVVIQSASGSFDASTKVATGSGTFEHRSASGALLASGTFSITKLQGFQFFGCGFAGGEPLPPDLCGGRAQFEAHAVVHPGGDPNQSFEIDVVFEVTCLVGHPPAGSEEGARTRVPGIINFNSPVSGETLFVRT